MDDRELIEKDVLSAIEVIENAMKAGMGKEITCRYMFDRLNRARKQAYVKQLSEMEACWDALSPDKRAELTNELYENPSMTKKEFMADMRRDFKKDYSLSQSPYETYVDEEGDIVEIASEKQIIEMWDNMDVSERLAAFDTFCATGELTKDNFIKAIDKLKEE